MKRDIEDIRNDRIRLADSIRLNSPHVIETDSEGNIFEGYYYCNDGGLCFPFTNLTLSDFVKVIAVDCDDPSNGAMPRLGLRSTELSIYNNF